MITFENLIKALDPLQQKIKQTYKKTQMHIHYILLLGIGHELPDSLMGSNLQLSFKAERKYFHTV